MSAVKEFMQSVFGWGGLLNPTVGSGLIIIAIILLVRWWLNRRERG